MVSTMVAPGPSLNTPSALVPQIWGLARCPLCHTQNPSMTSVAVSAGADWKCSRCDTRWDAVRLATVAGYAVWVAAHNAAVNAAPHAAAAA